LTEVQLQRFEDSAPETLEFDRLKDHFEPLIRSSTSGHAGHTPNARHNPITAAASHALAREVHGVSRHQSSKGAGRSSKSKSRVDPWDNYVARSPASGGDASIGASGGPEEVEWMRNLDRIEDVAPIEARWDASWSSSLRARRVRLLSPRTSSLLIVWCHKLFGPPSHSASFQDVGSLRSLSTYFDQT
jgi:dynactin-4